MAVDDQRHERRSALTIDVLANDTDLDGDTLTVTVSPGPTYGNRRRPVDGTVTYTPGANYNGPRQFHLHHQRW